MVVSVALAIGYKVRHENAESQKEIYSLNKVLSDKIKEIRHKEKARTIFFNNASHELRTPLQGTIGYIEMLDRGTRIAVSAGLNEVFQNILWYSTNQLEYFLNIDSGFSVYGSNKSPATAQSRGLASNNHPIPLVQLA